MPLFISDHDTKHKYSSGAIQRRQLQLSLKVYWKTRTTDAGKTMEKTENDGKDGQTMEKTDKRWKDGQTMKKTDKRWKDEQTMEKIDAFSNRPAFDEYTSSNLMSVYVIFTARNTKYVKLLPS